MIVLELLQRIEHLEVILRSSFSPVMAQVSEFLMHDFLY